MDRVLGNLKPERVYYYFEELSKIPRGSGNEKEVSDYLYNLFKNSNFERIQDDSLNVIIKKPASKGYEDAPVVMLQGHMDIVCEKNIGTEHDFEKDPIKIRIIGDQIYATNTTLGADDGIGIAMALAVLEDESLNHPPIEAVFTTDEERGMVGAINLDYNRLNSKILINLDSGGDGIFNAGCAGGCKVKYNIKTSNAKQTKKYGFNISIRGLIGGHSGANIHLGRGNSIKIMGRIINDLKDIIEISKIYSGLKDNAIPREADIIVSTDHKEELIERVKEWDKILKSEFSVGDPSISVEIKEEELQPEVYDLQMKNKIISVINLMPNGINTRNEEMKFVISSSNIGAIEYFDNNLIIKSSVRSSIESNIEFDILQRYKLIADIFDIEYEESNFYPGWEYNENSDIKQICIQAYERIYNEPPAIKVIHAGLECGYFKKRMPHLDAISFGPVKNGAHTPDEHLDIPTVEKSYKILLEILKNIK